MPGIRITIIDSLSQTRESFNFFRSPIHLGRNPTNTLVLQSPYISQWQGIVAFDETVVTYSDKQSANPARISGKPLDGDRPIALDPADRIFLGPHCIQIERIAGDGHASLIDGVGASERVRWAPPPELWGEAETVVYARPSASGRAFNDPIVAFSEQMGGGTMAACTDQAPEPLHERTPESIALDCIRAILKDCGVTDWHIDTPEQALKISARILGLTRLTAWSFIGLRSVAQEAAERLELPQGAIDAALFEIEDERALLRYIFDLKAPANDRLHALETALRGLMHHQTRALLGAIDGARGLLERLGPAEIDRELATQPIQLGRLVIPRRLWPFRTWSRWRHYLERRRQLIESEARFVEELFGRRFHALYAALRGERFDLAIPPRSAA